MGAFLLSTEVINIAILFSQVKVQSADQSETFLISGIPKEYEDLTESVQLEWFLQDIDSDETVQVHADAYLYGEGEIALTVTVPAFKMVSSPVVPLMVATSVPLTIS